MSGPNQPPGWPYGQQFPQGAAPPPGPYPPQPYGQQPPPGYYPVAQQRQQEPVNHLLHGLITVASCGLWLPVWIGMAITHGRRSRRAPGPVVPPPPPFW
ncbi:hypothetical protein [Saccharothrix hoggarensis]|uniref:DUF4190 domain-containing protein n=1 Tax=Saccharothrix hoggarensis TaxID=913853 RepID=A0ABW3QLP8_9PSEU